MERATFFGVPTLGCLAAGWSAVGCAGEPADSRGHVTVDSAGIRIVTSASPAWSADGGWHLSVAPTAVIGVVDGPPGEQLFGVVDAGLLSNGRVIVANGGTAELRIFDRDGRHVRSMGGEGEGPGEFSRIVTMDVAAGDSIFVWDGQTRRTSVFSAEGGFVRTVSLEPPSESEFPRFQGRFSDGTLLVHVPVVVSSAEIVDEAVRESRGPYMRYAAGGTPLDTIGSFHGSRSIIKVLGSDPSAGIAVMSVAFDPVTRLAIDGLRLYEGDGATFEIRRLGLDGSREAILRRSHEPEIVTADLLMREFERQTPPRVNLEDYLERIRSAYAAMPAGGPIPAFDRLLVDPAGRVWARNHPLPGDDAHAWSVFSADGRWLGDVSSHARLEVYAIGDDVIVGRERDELDVEHIVLYEIVRPATGVG